MNDDQTLAERLREIHAEITESDGGESGLMALVREAADEIEAWERMFELYWRANQRATELWRAAHPGSELMLPDQGKMIDWLVERDRSRD